MVERQEVEALLRVAEGCNEFGVISRKASTLAALCRAWLALDAGAPAIMDGRAALSVCAPTEDDFPALYALQGQRVRIVKEAGEW